VELLSWKTITKVTPDGGVIKKTLTEGIKYATPGTDALVRIRYIAALPDGTVFDERGEGNELEFRADDGKLPRFISVARPSVWVSPCQYLCN
jgi:FK506-binding protein 4/5